MFYMYVLVSKKDGKSYIGYTRDLKRRLRQHNQGENQSTAWRRPLKLVYYEAYASEEDARMREDNLKLFSRAYAQLRRRIGQSLK